jgi:hypothetical protein
MKWQHLLRRLEKSEVRGSGLRHTWGLGVALLLSLLVAVGGSVRPEGKAQACGPAQLHRHRSGGTGALGTTGTMCRGRDP